MMRRTKILLATATVAVMALVGIGGTAPSDAAKNVTASDHSWCC